MFGQINKLKSITHSRVSFVNAQGQKREAENGGDERSAWFLISPPFDSAHSAECVANFASEWISSRRLEPEMINCVTLQTPPPGSTYIIVHIWMSFSSTICPIFIALPIHCRNILMDTCQVVFIAERTNTAVVVVVVFFCCRLKFTQ